MIQLLQRIFIVPVIYGISFLPLRLLYLLSDILAWILRVIVKYRKDVVLSNLRYVFPGKSEKELTELKRAFYRHFTDIVMETLKLLTISEKGVLRHVQYEHSTLMNKYFVEGQSVLIAMGHIGNWEFCGAGLPLASDHTICAAYRPLRNEVFNNLVLRSRTKFGVTMFRESGLLRELVKSKGTVTGTMMVADQKPHLESIHWVSFMNRRTPAFKGIGKLSQMLGYPVVYMSTTKVQRGKYHVSFRSIADDPKNMDEGEIIQKYYDCLAEDIALHPDQWLWSHRRWKWREGMEEDIYSKS